MNSLIKRVLLTISSTFVILSFSNVLAFADSISDNNLKDVKFSIIGGIDLSKDNKGTFDKSRTITGKANEGSIITITSYEKLPQKEEKLKNTYEYSLVVGPSGYFSQNVDLVIGENIIVIEMKNNENVYKIKTNIKRKKSEIKNELEQAIVLSRIRK